MAENLLPQSHVVLPCGSVRLGEGDPPYTDPWTIMKVDPLDNLSDLDEFKNLWIEIHVYAK